MVRWDRPFPEPVKTGRTRRPLTGFFSNSRVSDHAILKGHFDATRDRVAVAAGPILVLQDTTEFSYQRERPELIGVTKSVNSGKDNTGRLRQHTVCGLLMHSSLVRGDRSGCGRGAGAYRPGRRGGGDSGGDPGLERRSVIAPPGGARVMVAVTPGLVAGEVAGAYAGAKATGASDYEATASAGVAGVVGAAFAVVNPSTSCSAASFSATAVRSALKGAVKTAVKSAMPKEKKQTCTGSRVPQASPC